MSVPSYSTARWLGLGIIYSGEAPVAQWTEQQPSKLLVVGSIPSRGARIIRAPDGRENRQESYASPLPNLPWVPSRESHVPS